VLRNQGTGTESDFELRESKESLDCSRYREAIWEKEFIDLERKGLWASMKKSSGTLRTTAQRGCGANKLSKQLKT
jgi:hypothetical protein